MGDPANFAPQTWTLPSGVSRQLTGTFESLTIISATYPDDIRISFNGDRFVSLPFGIGLDFPPTEVWIQNANASANTITVTGGNARIRDNRLLSTGGASTVPVSLQNVSVATTGLAANGAAIGGAGAPTLIAGQDGANVRTVLTDNAGRVQVTPAPSASVGASTTHHAISAASTNATSVKASAGTINGGIVCNANAAARFFKLYNKASAPVVGTDAPVLTLLVPAGGSVAIPAGAFGLRCATGIAYALTTGMAVADTGAVGAADLSVHLSYV